MRFFFHYTVLRSARFAGLALLALSWLSLAVADPSPQELVRDTTTRLLRAVEAERETIKENPDRLYELIEQHLLPVVDRERVARWVLGRHWRRATEEQRERFIREFQILLIRTYAAPMVEYTDVQISYSPLQINPGDTEAIVRTEIQASGREPVPVHYSMHRRDGPWKVYDVSVSGVSAVVTFRQTFADEIQRLGLEGLIRKLVEKNRLQTENSGIHRRSAGVS